MQNEVEDVAEMKEEIEELRRFKEWAEPILQELESFRTRAIKIAETVEEHDDEICLLQDRTDDVSAIKEELQDIQRFKISTETDLSDIDTFRKETEKKLKSMHSVGVKGKSTNKPKLLLGSPIRKSVNKTPMTEHECFMEDFITPEK